MSTADTSEAARILVVDDERSMCELVETTLGMRGFSVTWCQSADAALAVLREQNIDMVLTDVKMPGTSGIALCGEINRTRPELPVVVMTAFGSMETAVSALRAGAYDFVTKPIELDLLVATVHRAVDYSRLKNQVRVLL